MNMKKILLALFAGAVGTVALGVSAMAQTNEITFAEFLTNVEAGNGTYDGNGITVLLETTSGCRKNGGDCSTCEYDPADAGTPNRIQGTNAQYHLFSGEAVDIDISGVNFVADKSAGVAVCHGTTHGWNGAFEAGSTFNVELQFENHGSISLDECTFDGMNVSLYLDGKTTDNGYTAEITGCSFENVYNAYAIKQVSAANVLVDDNTFDNCAGGVYITNGCNGIVISNNEFSKMGTNATEEKQHTSGLIQIAASVDLNEDAAISVAKNTSDGSTPVIRQLSSNVEEILIIENEFGNSAMYTSDTAEDNEIMVEPVAMIGTTYYNTIAAAAKAAAESATESSPVTIQLAKGTFTESIILPANISYVTFKGANNHETIFKNMSIGHSGGMNDIKTNITFDGIVFENSNINLTAIYENTKIENMTITNCKFLNIQGKAAVSINTNILPNLDGFTFTNNVIDGVTGGSFSGLVLRAAPTGDIVITGNQISNVAWNAVQLVNLTADANVTIADNTMSSGASEGVLNIYNAKCGITLADNTINTVEGQNAISGFAPVAKIGDKLFTSLEAALKVAQNGDIITLTQDAEITEYIQINKNVTVDLGDNTITMSAEPNTAGFYPELRKCSYYITGNVTFKNGDMIVSNETYAQHGNFFVEVNKSLTFDNVALTTDGINAFALVQTYGDLNFENGAEVVMSNEASTFIYSEENLGDVAVNDSAITLDNVGAGISGSGIGFDATNATITMNNVSGKGLANVNGTVTDTNISISGAQTGISNTIGTLNVDGDSEIVVTGSTETDLKLGATAGIIVADTATVSVDKSDYAEGSTVGGEVISKAEIVYVQFKKTDLDDQNNDNDELKDVYELILAGYDAETINELASADITFKFEPTPVKGGKMAYDVIAATGVTASRLGESDRFMFNYNGIDKYEETGKAIKIATIEVSGYGTYNLGTDTTVDTNAVYATEIRDNKVDGFVPAADTLRLNLDMVENDGMVGEITATEILVPTRELKINIDFPNEATTNNKVAYQQMTVTVSGGDLEEALVIKLGDVAQITDLEKFAAKKSDKKAVSAIATKDAYDITITDLLTLSVAYNVTVEGVGYRTARHTVTMTDNKELFFWNNVKDKAAVVEEGKKTADVTFLAGDIVKDNNINIYDLSAVVSYFGEEGLGVDKRPEYAKYDLNRDGKIDSKDVAYVLVSWGK